MTESDVTTLEGAPAWIPETAMPSTSISPGRESDLLAIDPRPCEKCGLTIDRHNIVDDGEGPLFYCADLSPNEMTLPELERRAELIRQVEVAEIMARIFVFAVDDQPSAGRAADEPRPYRTPQATIDAFWYVVRLDNPDYLTRWLAQHPLDASALCKLWEGKNAA
jgi:hypothetical protein